jgi:hypothetical protein
MTKKPNLLLLQTSALQKKRSMSWVIFLILTVKKQLQNNISTSTKECNLLTVVKTKDYVGLTYQEIEQNGFNRFYDEMKQDEEGNDKKLVVNLFKQEGFHNIYSKKQIKHFVFNVNDMQQIFNIQTRVAQKSEYQKYKQEYQYALTHFIDPKKNRVCLSEIEQTTYKPTQEHQLVLKYRENKELFQEEKNPENWAVSNKIKRMFRKHNTLVNKIFHNIGGHCSWWHTICTCLFTVTYGRTRRRR